MTFVNYDKIKAVVKRYLNFFIGTRAALTFENRLFNSICLIAIFIMVFNIPFNYFSGLQITSLIFAMLTAVLGYIYYLARFRQRTTVGLIVTSLLVIILFAVNYFYSAGIRGASLLSFMLAFVLIIIVSPKKLYALWVSLILLVVYGLLLAEYRYPELVRVSYADEKALFVDIAFTYGTGVILCFFSLFYLKEAYNREKRSSDQKAIELERLNDEKLKLFSIISHDLQSPLSSLHSYIRLVSSDRFTPDERKQVEQGLANALHGTQELLSNMLAWSQSQLRGIQAKLTRNNIKQLLMPVIDVQRVYADQKNIILEADIDSSLWALVDRDMLQLIVRNLINNAIKFTTAGGRIVVSGKKIGTVCQISVEDNGIGIPPEKQGELFSLKVQSTYGTGNERGIGLGLFLCREYTQVQNGTISFTSEPNIGTRFDISLQTAESVQELEVARFA
ncbi:ATP-binding protein [Parapedobacter deserti]|uniref:histidine kinase n=1 Tax=Parapedobacter deserti TaxID=1912957 RepID=A0ABV7JHL9_9SPHI